MDHCGRDRMVVGFETTVQSVPITIRIGSSNPSHGEVYSIQHFSFSLVIDTMHILLLFCIM